MWLYFHEITHLWTARLDVDLGIERISRWLSVMRVSGPFLDVSIFLQAWVIFVYQKSLTILKCSQQNKMFRPPENVQVPPSSGDLSSFGAGQKARCQPQPQRLVPHLPTKMGTSWASENWALLPDRDGDAKGPERSFRETEMGREGKAGSLSHLPLRSGAHGGSSLLLLLLNCCPCRAGVDGDTGPGWM